MKKNFSYPFILCLFAFWACKNEVKSGTKNDVKTETKTEAKFGAPVVPPAIIFKDFTSFWAYTNEQIHLYEDFIGIDSTAHPLSREDFYRTLATGDYLPVRLSSTDGKNYYQLQKVPSGLNSDITRTVTNWASKEYNFYLLEGAALPKYNFVDLDGKTYTPESTKGKIVVLKCWFLKCMPCIAEIPTLNRIKSEYKNRNDILFLSICLDSKDGLKTFLKTTQFDYTQIGDQKKFLQDKLHIEGYPTHFVINKEGLIVRKTQKYEEMAYILKKEAAKN